MGEGRECGCLFTIGRKGEKREERERESESEGEESKKKCGRLRTEEDGLQCVQSCCE